MRPAIHLHIRALSLPSYDASQRNAFVAAMVHELIRRAAAQGAPATDAGATQVRAVADSALPADAGAQAGRAVADTVRGKS